MSKSTKTWLIIGAFILVVIIFLGSCIGIRNNMVTMQEDIKNAWAQVENQLQRRYDLIPNLVNTVKGYAKHEREIFIQIAEARAKLAGAGTYPDKVKAANQIESALGRLLVIVERYPLLKADANFRALMDELAGTENRLAVERKRYNDKVTEYNKYIKVIPNNMIAGMMGFSKADLYEIPEVAKETPKVEF
ncbi:MAG: LemA family protein [Spirochaetes bacterium]|nr:LemA family protein [Spirochaetota bacterium]